jgi:hypothetical protein
MKRIINYLARKTNFDSSRNGTFIRIFGLWLAYKPFGNCFSPALIFTPYTIKGCRAFHFKIRTRNHRETSIYYCNFRLWWNSEHLAVRFGEFTETDFGGVYRWRNHLYL